VEGRTRKEAKRRKKRSTETKHVEEKVSSTLVRYVISLQKGKAREKRNICLGRKYPAVGGPGKRVSSSEFDRRGGEECSLHELKSREKRPIAEKGPVIN